MKKYLSLSLAAQVYSLIVGVALLTVSASLYNNINSMRGYLNAQLASHAQGAAHHLGLSISPYLDDDNFMVAETMASAIFDSGYYLQIRLVDLDGNEKFNRQTQLKIREVPDWFIAWLPLSPPMMSSEITDGWGPAGTLQVQSHPGISYATLWQQTIRATGISLGMLLLALLLSYLILRAVLGPLRGMEQQALGVMQKRFELNKQLPFTKELRHLVQALNRMVSNVQLSFAEQTALADRLSQEVYLDAMTDLPNRRALLKQFATAQHECELQGETLYLGLISLPSLTEINLAEGYSGGDDYICSVAKLLQRQMSSMAHLQAYRVSGSEFALLARVADIEALQLDHALAEAFAVARTTRHVNAFARHAMVKIASQEDFVQAMKRLDSLTAQHQYFQPDKGLAAGDPQSNCRSRLEWLKIFDGYREVITRESASMATGLVAPYASGVAKLASDPGAQSSSQSVSLENIFDLLLQPVIDHQQDILYVESFIRFKLGNQVLSTTEVIAMANHFGMLLELEKAVICFILNRLQRVTDTRVAINISNSALHDKEFRGWLFNLLYQRRQQLPPLVFEINEIAALASVASTTEFINQAKAQGIAISIERFGSSLSSFKYIRNLDIDFIKLDGSYIQDLLESDTRFFVQTVTQICHGIGIKVIAPQVENQRQANSCKALNVDALQGRGLHPVHNFNNIYNELCCNEQKTSLQFLTSSSTNI